MKKEHWRQFKAFDTEIVFFAELETGQSALFDLAEAEIRSFEKKFSRFLDDSELSRFNRDMSEKTAMSRDFIDLIELAKYFFRITGGIFDPTVIEELEKIGYGKSFAETDAILSGVLLPAMAKKGPSMENIQTKGNEVAKAPGLRLDFGGIGKGYIVDKLGDSVFHEIDNYWLSAGGDLLLKGSARNQSGWTVDIEHPVQLDGSILKIQTKGNALGIATSGINRRRGGDGDNEWHHLIDPRTGLPAKNEIIAVTAIAGNAKEADVFAKTVLILGVAEGLEFIERQNGCAAIIFTKNTKPVFSRLAQNYL